MRTWIRRLALPLVALAASQVGHLIAYQVWLGPRAIAVQSQGAHTLFPFVFGAAAASLGAVLVASLLVLGTARLLVGRGQGLHRTGGRPLLETFALLFTLQLGIFVVQELVETSALGATPPGVAQLLLWGILGQLPVAAAAALALRWISTRIESALAVLRNSLRRSEAPAAELVIVLPQPAAAGALRISAPSAFAKRGPPQDLLHQI
jgi:hypothetical protein